MKKWETLSSQYAFFHKWYKVLKETVKLPSGQIIDDYYVSDRPDVVLVFAKTINDKVIIVEQYKHGAKEFLFELPGGVVDEGEDKEMAIYRELLEETGYRPESINCIGEYTDDPTKNRNRFYFYFADNCQKVGEQKLDQLEEIEVHLIDILTLKNWLATQKINTCSSVALSYLVLTQMK